MLGEGGGGGGGFVDSQTSRSLDSFLSLVADTELQSSRMQTKNNLENLKFVRLRGGGGGSLIFILLDHLIP